MLTFERVHSREHPYFEKAFELYQLSFPEFEQRLLADQIAALSDPKYHFNVILGDNDFLGIILTWCVDEFVYIEHLAINPEERGNNIGTRTLTHLKSVNDKPIILEIDPPVDDISIKRRHFYERVGFIESELVHEHLPYQLGWGPHSLKIMSYPRISDQIYHVFKTYLETHIMMYAA